MALKKLQLPLFPMEPIVSGAWRAATSGHDAQVPPEQPARAKRGSIKSSVLVRLTEEQGAAVAAKAKAAGLSKPEWVRRLVLAAIK